MVNISRNISVMTTCGRIIDVTFWVKQMCENHKNKENIFVLTPIGRNVDGDYFWFDEDENPTLIKTSVQSLIKEIKCQS